MGSIVARRAVLLSLAFALWPQAAHAQWMGELYDDPVVGEQWKQTRLADIVFPGTHDSGTYAFYGPEVPIGNELAAGDLLLASLMDIADTLGVSDEVAAAQDLTVGEQLDAGVRALDIRTYYDVIEQEMRVTHTWKGPPLTEILDDLAAFVDDPANSREVIVFQFFNASADVARVNDPGLNEQVIREIFNHPLPSGGTLKDKFIPWDVGARPRQFYQNGAEVSDPTVEEALATGGQIVFAADRTRYQLFNDGHDLSVYAKMWQSPSRAPDFFGTPTSGEYPPWYLINTEGRAFDLMSQAAAKRPPLYSRWVSPTDNTPAPPSYRYLSPLGLHSGINTWDLTLGILVSPVVLEEYARRLNPDIIPQLASLPRDKVNIVELDYYSDWMTPWFKALNRGVVSIEVGPYATSSSDWVFGEWTDYGDGTDGDPDFYPMYIGGATGQFILDNFPNPAFRDENEERYNPDVGGGREVAYPDARAVTLQMSEAAGYWDYNRFAEVHSSAREPLFIGFAESDALDQDEIVTINPTSGYWAAYYDLRYFVGLAVGPAGVSYDVGPVTLSGNVDWATAQSAHAAWYVYEETFCEWGVNCPEDDPQVIDPSDTGPGFPYLQVLEGGTLSLAEYGHDSVYSSAVSTLKWDVSPAGPPYNHTVLSKDAVFDAAGLAPGVYPISLAIARTSTDVTGVLDSLIYYVHVCTDADRDGITDGGPNTFVCPDLDECEGDDEVGDTDADGVCDDLDACPNADDSIDADGDGVPDACDICADGDDEVDTDRDGVPDACDVCAFGDDAIDEDLDGVPDGCDDCEGDDASGDSDDDGVCDDLDACEGADDFLDADDDGVADACDDCEGDDASGDSDGDGVCDDLDACASGDDSVDADGDGIADACDECVGDEEACPEEGERARFRLSSCGCEAAGPIGALGGWLPLVALVAARRRRQ